ncbi:MAG: DUF1553 domain-containing protein [Pirellulales bacterium]
MRAHPATWLRSRHHRDTASILQGTGSPKLDHRAGFSGWQGTGGLIAALVLVLLAARPGVADDTVDFEREIRPLLRTHCVGCHGPELQEGGLRLDARSLALRGGDNGPVIVPRKSAESELLRRVASQDKSEFMPPKGDRLNASQVERLRRWIDQGAPWEETAADKAAARDPRLEHWAWQPLVRPAIPPSPAGLPPAPPSADDSPAARARAVDAFIAVRLAKEGLSRSPPADRRTLFRRLSFDLLGLPPAPEDVERFVADPDPRAYERLVDELLRSPRYGERWARHWLDVVHYGDTHGYDKDKLRPHAWPYRDYVIRAWNEDKPYARFIEEQLAGDVLYPGTRDGVEALGFIAAGPWDFIGHAEVPETKIDGKIARHLDRDDMVANTLGTFCSVTIHCAQCHNHKFDPFTQDDYYSLQAVFAALDRADRSYFSDPAVGQRHGELTVRQRELGRRRQELEEGIRRTAGTALTDLETRIEAASKQTQGNTAVEFGYHSALASDPRSAKWVQVDLGSEIEIERVVLRPCYDDFNQIGAGFGFPVRFRVEASVDPTFAAADKVHVIADRTTAAVANPGTAPLVLTTGKLRTRYLRVTATQLALRQNDYMLALAELEALDAAGMNRARGAAVTALDSIEAAPRWRQSNLVDGLYPVADTSGQLAELREQREALLRKHTDQATYDELVRVREQLAGVAAELKQLPAPQLVYAGTVHTGSGAFLGTGGNGGKPRPIHILQRGNVLQPGREAGPGALAALDMLPGRFALPADHAEGERRAALARWLADPQNPLTWRSIVNRVWQYHFGRGLVETSNDFGQMGQLPSHPELLDWLACEFRDGGGSLKSLHRLLVLSETYRQSSGGAEAAGEAERERIRRSVAVDSENRLLWRQNRRKLEAEAIHDAVLAVSGKLDLTMGGPGYQDFVIQHPEHSPHYEYQLADPNDARTWRRSVYRFIVRSQTQPFMTSLDCADPSMRVERRNESMSAIQALALLNNGFMVTQAAHFADRVRREAGPDSPRQIERAVQLALGRSPATDEREVLEQYRAAQGLENLCRALLNLNEFTFVD